MENNLCLGLLSVWESFNALIPHILRKNDIFCYIVNITLLKSPLFSSKYASNLYTYDLKGIKGFRSIIRVWYYFSKDKLTDICNNAGYVRDFLMQVFIIRKMK